MAEDRYNIIVGTELDEKSAEQTGKYATERIKKGMGNNGYVKLGVEITDYKYPKQTKTKGGINYSKLQKAQDELISNWNKLSKKGFSSDDEKLLDVLRSYRNYSQQVKSQYKNNETARNTDDQVKRIQDTIGVTLHNYFERLVKNEKGRSISLNTNKLTQRQFEEYAKQAIQKYHAAQLAGVNLSKTHLNKDDISKISIKNIQTNVANQSVAMAKLTSSFNSTNNYLKDAAQQIGTLLALTKVNDTSALMMEETQEQILEEDKNSGGNTDEFSNKTLTKQDRLTTVTETIYKILMNLSKAFGNCPCQDILSSMLQSIQSVQTVVQSIQTSLQTIQTNGISIINKKPQEQTKQNQTESTAQDQLKRSKRKETTTNKNVLALDVHRDKSGKQDEFVKDVPFRRGEVTTPTVFRKNELINKNLSDDRIRTTELARRRNRRKNINTASVINSGGFNPLAPTLYRDKKTGRVAEPIPKLDIINAKEILEGIKKPFENLDLERLKSFPEFLQNIFLKGRGNPKEEGLLPNWRQAETQAEKEANEAKELEEARKRLIEQIKLETELARRKNQKKQSPITPAIINAPGEVDKLSAIKFGWKRIFQELFSGSEVERTLKMSEGERARETARRRELYGETFGRDQINGTGILASIKYKRKLWRGNNDWWAANGLSQDVRKTDSIKDIDTKALMAEIQNSLQKGMFKAQTGGALRNLIGSTSFYLGMPSLEKSRAEAEGLNQAIANVRNKALTLLQKIQANQAVLKEYERAGEITYNDDGSIKRDTSRGGIAEKTFIDLEQQKDVFRSLQAEMNNIDKVSARWKGNIHQILKHLSFMMPELREENVIIQNINAGLDKNGKALKFQTRTAEIFDYSLKSMARHVGQMWKRWMLQLNPITQIRKMFKDFMSYDVKWKRTMNVIKYNFRRIIKPAMQWIAQQIVNILGLVNALMKGVGKAFGKNWDLFDKDAANTEKMLEDLEAMQNVTAGFDELHDIGANNGAENDLFGDIYTPQWEELYKTLEGVGEKIGLLFQSEKLQDIFDKIGKAIKWCIDNWKIFVGLLAGFVIAKSLWNLFKWFNTLSNILGGVSLTPLISGLLIVAGTIGMIKTVWDSIEWAKNWGGMLPSERQEKADENVKKGEISGALLGAGIGGAIGGVPGAIIGALIGDGAGEAFVGTFNTIVSAWHGDTEGTKKAAEKAGEGFGKVVGTAAEAAIGAKIGATIGSFIAPGVGTAIGAGIGAIVGGISGWIAGGKLGKAMGKVWRRYYY